MGKLENGLWGGFSGRVGNLVGVVLRGRHYVRVAPAHVHNPNTEGQRTQRGRFTVAVAFVRSILPYVRVGFRNDAQTCSAYNAAQSCIMKYAIEGKGKDCTLNYATVFVARGMLVGAQQAKAVRTDEGVLFSWTNNSGEVDARPKDVAMPLVYNTVRKEGVWDTEQAIRRDEQMEIKLPDAWNDEDCVAYLAFRSESGEAVSNSVYLGIVE